MVGPGLFLDKYRTSVKYYFDLPPNKYWAIITNTRVNRVLKTTLSAVSKKLEKRKTSR
jgi:hypothetical protein